MSPIRSGAVLGIALLAAPLAAEPPPLPRPLAEREVCGDPRLLGRPLPEIRGEQGCGIAAPISLSAAAGVALQPAATLDCQAARALAGWVEEGATPAFAARGAKLRALAVADAYSCRKRNRTAAGKLSEHALGHAIDVGGFRFGGGAAVTVRDGWDSAAWGATLRQLQDAGCGRFGTVLGPEANPLHADHLHFDVASRRSGPWCE